MKPRRILIFSLSYFPRLVGGAEVAVKEITDRIPPSEIVFDMVTLGDGISPREEKIGNVNVYRLSGGAGTVEKLLYPWKASLMAQKLLRTNIYDAVWAIMASYAGYAAYLLKRKYERLPVILNIQEGDNFRRRQGIFRPVFVRIFRNADYIHALSAYLAAWSREVGAACPVEIVPNAVDTSLFTGKVSQLSLDDLGKKYCRKDGDIFLITTSRLVAKNGVGDIISSLQFLPKNVKLLVLGQGPLENELKCQALKLGLNYTDEPPVNPGNRVHFAGYVEHRDMPPYLAMSDVFVRPSISEGLGISFLEAMAAGVPVIATAVGGIPDFLKEGVTGLFAEVRNPKSIAGQVERYLNDPKLREAVVKKARAMIVEKYDWDRIAGEMRRIFDSISK